MANVISRAPENVDYEVPRCPRCGWQDVRASTPRGLVDALLGTLSMVPWRCRSCGFRFHRLRRRPDVEEGNGESES